jgi:hypothetical protein
MDFFTSWTRAYELKKDKNLLHKKLLISYMKKLYRPVSGTFFFISFSKFFIYLMLSFIFTATLFSSLINIASPSCFYSLSLVKMKLIIVAFFSRPL